MVNMTLAIPADLHKLIKKHDEVKWSEVARKAIRARLENLQMAEKIASKSKLTSKYVEEFSRKINLAASKRFMNEDSS